MYKILIADDEGIVLDSLKFIIEKNFGETCQMATAKSGRAVIEQAHLFTPDIALLDIHMPGINGIDAMKEIRKFLKDVVFVVISAYDKFSFAREALSLGAIDYITKPFTKDRVTEAIENAMGVVDLQRKQLSNDLEIKEKLQTIVPILENGLINLILFQEDSIEEMEQYRNLLEVTEEYGNICTVEFGERGGKGGMENPIGSSVKMLRSHMKPGEIIKDFFPGAVVGSIMANKVVFYLPRKSKSVDYEDRSRIVEQTRNMVHKLQQKFNCSFRCGIGGNWDFHSLHQSYEESKKALRLGTGSVVHVQDLGLNCDYAPDYPSDLEAGLFRHVHSGNVAQTQEAANQFFDWMVSNYGDHERDIQTKVLEFVMTAEKEVFMQGGMQYGFLFRQNYLSELLACPSYEALRRWFLERITAACRNVTLKNVEKKATIVEKAKEYIHQKGGRDISLEEVAQYVDISPYYFSKLFKEEAGENFIEYLTSFRIEKAKQMLLSGTGSIKEICIDAGYADPNYFSRIFKKIVGCTPTEYRDGTGIMETSSYQPE
jgi:two-component system response regulator YesN